MASLGLQQKSMYLGLGTIGSQSPRKKLILIVCFKSGFMGRRPLTLIRRCFYFNFLQFFLHFFLQQQRFKLQVQVQGKHHKNILPFLGGTDDSRYFEIQRTKEKFKLVSEIMSKIQVSKFYFQNVKAGSYNCQKLYLQVITVCNQHKNVSNEKRI